MSTSHNPLRDSRLHRTGATLTRHAGRLKQGALLLTALAAIYAIWLGVGLPALPITGGHTPHASGTQFVTQIGTPTASRIHKTALLTKQNLPKPRVRIPRHDSPHAGRPTSRQTAGPPAATGSPRPEHLARPDGAAPAGAEHAEATAAAPPPATVSTAPATTTPPPPPAPPPSPITLPPLPQVPPPPDVVQLPQEPDLPEIPAPPQLPVSNVPQLPTQTPTLTQLP